MSTTRPWESSIPVSAGGMHRISLRGRVHPNSLSLLFPSLLPSAPLHGLSPLWTLVLLCALPQIPDCSSLLCKHLVKTVSSSCFCDCQLLPLASPRSCFTPLPCCPPISCCFPVVGNLSAASGRSEVCAAWRYPETGLFSPRPLLLSW